MRNCWASSKVRARELTEEELPLDVALASFAPLPAEPVRDSLPVQTPPGCVEAVSEPFESRMLRPELPSTGRGPDEAIAADLVESGGLYVDETARSPAATRLGRPVS